MLPDYYDRLGVVETATMEEITRAYRRLAMRYHPDRGGSHEEMVGLNETFQILSNPQSRAQYDRARKDADNEAVQRQARESSAKARRQAENYARDWTTFELWLNKVSTDFHSAEYGAYNSPKGPMPTAGKSISGWVFIAIGFMLGAMVGLAIIPFPPVAAMFGVIGAWLGSALHRAVRSTL